MITILSDDMTKDVPAERRPPSSSTDARSRRRISAASALPQLS